jgi:WD40 repeat protein
MFIYQVTLKNWKIVHKLHSRGLFTISSYENEGKQMIWTSAQDRNLFLWQLECDGPEPKEVLGIPEMEDPWLCVPTLGGFVYCINLNPIDASHVALGLGDGTIRLWNTAAAKPDMSMLWNGIKGNQPSL